MMVCAKICRTGMRRLIGVVLLSSLIAIHHPATQASEVELADVLPFKQRELATDNVLLSLSIDDKSVAAAYRASVSYDRTKDFPGYFNPRKCYTYSTSHVFVIAANADSNHECRNAFSGNFMNWATTSTVDLIRYGLTGGDRVIDDSSQTVLQRAVLPAAFYANVLWFPRRSIARQDGGNVSPPSAVTPFSDSTIHIVSCANVVLLSAAVPGAAAPAACQNAGNTPPASFSPGTPIGASPRAFVLRVRVCDADEGATRNDLCQRFGAAYKPVGVLQKKSERMRFAVMSYLADTTAERYGGVLRSAMKYIGPRKILVPSFGDADNEFKEWDADTGILYSNPDTPTDRNSTTQKSGVLNYINQFGRSGVYRTFDPVGELFYEGLRYFQAKPPTANAASTPLNATMREGFPVITTWADPMTSSCQKNQIVVIADAVTNWDFHLPGNTRATMQDGTTVPRPANRPIEATAAGKVAEPNAMTWTETVGKMEVNAGNAYVNPAPVASLANLHQKDTGDLDYATYYISGLAYWANTQAIRTDYPTARVKTMVIDIDRGGDGSITMPTRDPMPKESQLFLAAKYGGYTDFTEDANPYTFRALEPERPMLGSNAEWDSDADNVPDRYFLASQPGAMVSALHKIAPLPTIFSGSALTGATLSSVQVAPTATFLFQAGFDSYRWSGRLEKRRITANASTGVLTLATTPEWDAGVILTGSGPVAAPNPSPDARAIFTSHHTADNSFETIPFDWPVLPTEYQDILNKSPVTGATDGAGERRLSFLRGRRDNAEANAGNLRNRTSVLGDIVNSNVVYVGAPTRRIAGADYQTFFEANKDRTPAVYVGANDGMLHAFRADSGVELFAYIPRMLLPKLNRLTVPDYPHEPYVDGQITVAEARIGSTTWATVLAAGLGGGAQGVFALDVTNPVPADQPEDADGAAKSLGGFNSAGRPGALFEFSDSDDKDMGNVLAAPVIAKFRTGVVNGVPRYKYFVVVSSGVNNAKPDGDHAGGAPKYNSAAPGAIFLLSLEKRRDQPWELGMNYYKFLLPAADTGLQNGVASPALVLGDDGAVKLAYVGDLQGRLWRLNFSGNAPWRSARPSDTPLFVARDAAGQAQPITQQPRVVFAPQGGYVVLFGTGKYLETADVRPANYRGQSFYAIYDNVDPDFTVARSALAPRTLSAASTGGAYSIAGNVFSYGKDAPAKKGWYVDFLGTATSGERSVTDPVISNGQVLFTTISPGNDICASGSGRTYVLDALSGLAGGVDVGQLSTVGLPGAPLILQVGNVTAGTRNSVGRRSSSVKTAIVNTGVGVARGSTAVSANPAQTRSLPSGRFSWREIFNWMESGSENN